MNLWEMEKWRDYYRDKSYRKGLRIDFDKEVDPEVRRAIKEFASWLRMQYEFPKRVRMYVKSSRRIKARDGDQVCATCFLPYNRDEEPYIRVATGDFAERVVKRGADNALAEILWTVCHELTHYFQWLNDVKLSPIGEERQATNYANRIMDEYAGTREHP